MFGPRIPNVAKIKSEEPRIEVVKRTFDFVLPICLKADVKRLTFYFRLVETFFVERSSLEKEKKKRRKENGVTTTRRMR